MDEQLRRNRHYAAVYGVLSAFADPERRRPRRGTEGAIGRAQHHFDLIGETGADEILAAASLAIFRLRHALWRGDEAEQAAQRAVLARLARAWLREAPMLAIPPALLSAGAAA